MYIPIFTVTKFYLLPMKELNGILLMASPLDRLKTNQLVAGIPNTTIRKEFSSAVEASEFLTYHPVDFILLQPQLPVFDGFDFINNLKENTNIILISNQPSDALRAYELGLIDCLPNRFSRERLEISLNRIREKDSTSNRPQTSSDPLYLVVRCNLKNEKIPIDTIQWVEAMGDYVKIVTEQKNFVVLSTMKAFMDQLPQDQFFRIHKSYIVNLNKVQGYRFKEIEIAQTALPLSRTRKKEFEKQYTLTQ